MTVSLLGSGCSLVVKQVNATWPPQSTLEKQLESVRESIEAVSELDGPPEYYAGIAASDLNEHVGTLLRAHVPEVESVSITADRQQLVLSGSFSGTFGDPEVQMSGRAIISAPLGLRGSKLRIRPSFAQIKLSRLKYKKTEIPTGIVEVANRLLTTFIDNINGALQTQEWDLGTRFVATMDPTSLLKDQPGLQNVYGTPIQINTALVRGALLVDVEGVHVLGDVVNLPPDQVENVATGLLAKSSTLRTALSAAELGFINSCDDLLKLAPTGSPVLAACERFRQPSAAPQAVASPGDFDTLYGELTAKFMSAAVPLGDRDALSWTRTAGAVSKKFLAETINHYTTGAEFGGSYAGPKTYLHFNEELRTGPAAELHCDENHQWNCDPQTDCNPNWACQERGCPGSCGFFDAGCHAWKPVCEALKAAEKAGCEADKVRYRAQCEATKTAQRIACEANKAAALAACKVNQNWLYAWKETNIGRIQGTVAVDGASAQFRIAHEDSTKPTFLVAPDFSRLTARASAAANANVLADLEFHPWELGHILCAARWNGRVIGTLSSSRQFFDISATIEPKRRENELDLFLSMQPIDLKLKMEPPPIKGLFAQNPHVAVVCAPAVVVGLAGHLYGEIEAAIQKKENQMNLLKDTFDLKVPSFTFPITLPVLEVSIKDSNPPNPPSATMLTLELRPEWRDKTIVYLAPEREARPRPPYIDWDAWPPDAKRPMPGVKKR